MIRTQRREVSFDLLRSFEVAADAANEMVGQLLRGEALAPSLDDVQLLSRELYEKPSVEHALAFAPVFLAMQAAGSYPQSVLADALQEMGRIFAGEVPGGDEFGKAGHESGSTLDAGAGLQAVGVELRRRLDAEFDVDPLALAAHVQAQTEIMLDLLANIEEATSLLLAEGRLVQADADGAEALGRREAVLEAHGLLLGGESVAPTRGLNTLMGLLGYLQDDDQTVRGLAVRVAGAIRVPDEAARDVLVTSIDEAQAKDPMRPLRLFAAMLRRTDYPVAGSELIAYVTSMQSSGNDSLRQWHEIPLIERSDARDFLRAKVLAVAEDNLALPHPLHIAEVLPLLRDLNFFIHRDTGPDAVTAETMSRLVEALDPMPFPNAQAALVSAVRDIADGREVPILLRYLNAARWEQARAENPSFTPRIQLTARTEQSGASVKGELTPGRRPAAPGVWSPNTLSP